MLSYTWSHVEFNFISQLTSIKYIFDLALSSKLAIFVTSLWASLSWRRKPLQFWRHENWVGKYCVTCLELHIKCCSRCKPWPMSFTCIPYCTLGMSSYQACLPHGSTTTPKRFLGWAGRQETFSSYYQPQSQLIWICIPPDVWELISYFLLARDLSPWIHLRFICGSPSVGNLCICHHIRLKKFMKLVLSSWQGWYQ